MVLNNIISDLKNKQDHPHYIESAALDIINSSIKNKQQELVEELIAIGYIKSNIPEITFKELISTIKSKKFNKVTTLVLVEFLSITEEKFDKENLGYAKRRKKIKILIKGE